MGFFYVAFLGAACFIISHICSYTAGFIFKRKVGSRTTSQITVLDHHERELRDFKDQSAKNLRRQVLLNELLYERITGLESSTVIRNRSLSVYKRDNIGREFLTDSDRNCIEKGNQTAHGVTREWMCAPRGRSFD